MFLTHLGVAFGTFLGHLLGLNPAGVSVFRMHRAASGKADLGVAAGASETTPLGLKLAAWGFAVSDAWPTGVRSLPGTPRWMVFRHFACAAEALVLVFLKGSKVGLGRPWRRSRSL